MAFQRPAFNRYSRNSRDLFGKRGLPEKDDKMTKAQERAKRTLEEAKSGVRGMIPDRSSLNVPAFDRLNRGTSAARTRRRRRVIVIEEEGDDDEELDKRAAEAEMGIASPLPRALIRPIAVTIKKVHGLENGEVSEFKE